MTKKKVKILIKKKPKVVRTIKYVSRSGQGPRVEASGTPIVKVETARRADPTHRNTRTDVDRYVVGKTVGGYLGSVLGGAPGGIVGNWIGGKAHEAFHKITGWGSYNIRSQNLHNHLSNGGTIARHTYTGLDGDYTVFRRREWIGNVYSSIGFKTTTFKINPGLRGPPGTVMFPWLSGVSRSYQQYQIGQCVLNYVSSSSEYTAVQALGKVYMSSLYDATEDPLSNVGDVENNDYTTSAKPSVNFWHAIECSPAESVLMTRALMHGSTETGDPRFVDLGLFQVSTNGNQNDGTNLGSVYIEYDVALLKNRMPALAEGTSYQGTFYQTNIITNIPMFDVAVRELNGANSLPMTVSGNSVVFPAGYEGVYSVTLHAAVTKQNTDVWTNFCPTVASFGSSVKPINVMRNISASDPTGAGTVPTSLGIVGSYSQFSNSSGAWQYIDGVIHLIVKVSIGDNDAARTINFAAPIPNSAGEPRVNVYNLTIAPLDINTADPSEFLARMMKQNKVSPELLQMFNQLSISHDSASTSSSFAHSQPHPLCAASSSSSSSSLDDSLQPGTRSVLNSLHSRFGVDSSQPGGFRRQVSEPPDHEETLGPSSISSTPIMYTREELLDIKRSMRKT